eukprot:scaffold743_cov267-Pinguiococcus_pyrenoidosus.AAC.30
MSFTACLAPLCAAFGAGVNMDWSSRSESTTSGPPPRASTTSGTSDIFYKAKFGRLLKNTGEMEEKKRGKSALERFEPRFGCLSWLQEPLTNL